MRGAGKAKRLARLKISLYEQTAGYRPGPAMRERVTALSLKSYGEGDVVHPRAVTQKCRANDA